MITPHADSGTSRSRISSAALVILIPAALVRMVVAFLRVGSNDIRNWWHFSSVLKTQPLRTLYRRVNLFNNPLVAGISLFAKIRIRFQSVRDFNRFVSRKHRRFVRTWSAPRCRVVFSFLAGVFLLFVYWWFIGPSCRLKASTSEQSRTLLR